MTFKLKPIHHSRSKSSPIKPHPQFRQFNKLLNKLESLQVASSSQPLSYKLEVLVHLHTNLCQMTCMHEYVSKKQDDKLAEFLLDGSISLIDACETIRDVLMHTREETQRLLSALRRKLNEDEVAKEVNMYINSRKIVKKVIVKLLKAIERFAKKLNTDTIKENQENSSIVHVLQKSQSISVDVLKSLISYVAGSRTLLYANKWFLFSKMMHFRDEPFEEEDCSKRNIFEVVDVALCMLARPKTVTSIKNIQIENLRNHLEDLRLMALDLESTNSRHPLRCQECPIASEIHPTITSSSCFACNCLCFVDDRQVKELLNATKQVPKMLCLWLTDADEEALCVEINLHSFSSNYSAMEWVLNANGQDENDERFLETINAAIVIF